MPRMISAIPTILSPLMASSWGDSRTTASPKSSRGTRLPRRRNGNKEASRHGAEGDEGRLRLEDGRPAFGVGRQAEGDEGEGGEGSGAGQDGLPAAVAEGEGAGEARAGAQEARRDQGRQRGALGGVEVRVRGCLERAEEERRLDEDPVSVAYPAGRACFRIFLRKVFVQRPCVLS